MPERPLSTTARDFFEQILAEILQAEESGRTPDLGRYLDSFPELAGPLRDYFRDREGFERLAPQLDPAAADSTPCAAPQTAPSGAVTGQSIRDGWPDIPGYEVLSELGHGGMGIVYKARHQKLNRTVALKMILSDGHAQTDDRQRFQREAEAVARLQHPHIVQIHEIGQYEGSPFFTLKFCPGGSLADKLAGTPLPIRETAELLQTLARAVNAAHQKNIIHRDLKPAMCCWARTAPRRWPISDWPRPSTTWGTPSPGRS
jgi:serine/threonine-protein kinase